MPPEVTSGTAGLLVGEDQVMELGPIYYKCHLSKHKNPLERWHPLIVVMVRVRQHLYMKMAFGSLEKMTWYYQMICYVGFEWKIRFWCVSIESDLFYIHIMPCVHIFLMHLIKHSSWHVYTCCQNAISMLLSQASNVTNGFDLDHNLDLWNLKVKHDLDLSPHTWPWPWIFMVKFLNSCISEWEGRLTLHKGGGSRSFMTMNVTIWWLRSGVWIYQIVTGVTSVVGMPRLI